MHGVVTPGEDRRTTPTKDQMKHEGHLMQSHDAQQQVLSLQPQQQMSPPNTADTSRKFYDLCKNLFSESERQKL